MKLRHFGRVGGLVEFGNAGLVTHGFIGMVAHTFL